MIIIILLIRLLFLLPPSSLLLVIIFQTHLNIFIPFIYYGIGGMNGNKKCIYWLLCLNFMWPRTFLFLYLVWDFSESEETNGAGN